MNEDDPVITLENIHYYEKQRTNHFILIQQLNILLEQTILNERKEYGKIFHNKINIPLYINICEAMILALDEQETVDGDDDNILMTIPPEILEKMDWVPGDIIKISQDDNGSITMSKKDVDGKE